MNSSTDPENTSGGEIAETLAISSGMLLSCYFLIIFLIFIVTTCKSPGTTQTGKWRCLDTKSVLFRVCPNAISIFTLAFLHFDEYSRHFPESESDTQIQCTIIRVLGFASAPLYALPQGLEAVWIILQHERKKRGKIVIGVAFGVSLALSVSLAALTVDRESAPCWLFNDPWPYSSLLMLLSFSFNGVALSLLLRRDIQNVNYVKKWIKKWLFLWGTLGVGYVIYVRLSISNPHVSQKQWRFPAHYLIILIHFVSLHQSFSSWIRKQTGSQKVSLFPIPGKSATDRKRLVPEGYTLEKVKTLAETATSERNQNKLSIPIEFPQWFPLGFSDESLRAFHPPQDGYMKVATGALEATLGACISTGDLPTIDNDSFNNQMSAIRDETLATKLERLELSWNHATLKKELRRSESRMTELARLLCHNWLETHKRTPSSSSYRALVFRLSSFQGSNCMPDMKDLLRFVSPYEVKMNWTTQRLLTNHLSLHLLKLYSRKLACPELVDFFEAVREFKRRCLIVLMAISKYQEDDSKVPLRSSNEKTKSSDTVWDYHSKNFFTVSCNMLSRSREYLLMSQLHPEFDDSFIERNGSSSMLVPELRVGSQTLENTSNSTEIDVPTLDATSTSTCTSLEHSPRWMPQETCSTSICTPTEESSLRNPSPVRKQKSPLLNSSPTQKQNSPLSNSSPPKQTQNSPARNPPRPRRLSFPQKTPHVIENAIRPLLKQATTIYESFIAPECTLQINLGQQVREQVLADLLSHNQACTQTLRPSIPSSFQMEEILMPELRRLLHPHSKSRTAWDETKERNESLLDIQTVNLLELSATFDGPMKEVLHLIDENVVYFFRKTNWAGLLVLLDFLSEEEDSPTGQ